MEYWTIKEASKKLGVEAHVLRYWEEELGLTIKRNDMGHRYYDERNIQMFCEIQQLKERGLLLKDIRDAIKKYEADKQQGNISLPGKVELQSEGKQLGGDAHQEDNMATDRQVQSTPTLKLKEDNPQIVDFKTAQLQSIMNRVVANALRENKDIIKASVKEEVARDVLKQFDIVMRENEEREEERFRKLDESIRKLQLANEEVAATRMKKHRWGRR